MPDDASPVSPLKACARVLRVVWSDSRSLVVATSASIVLQELQPILLLAIVKILVDRVVAGVDDSFWIVFGQPLAALLILTIGFDAANRIIRVRVQLTADRLAHRLDGQFLAHLNKRSSLKPFEDPAFHDQMLLARRGSGAQFVSVFNAVISVFGSVVSLVMIAVILATLSAWLLLVIVLTTLPGVILQFTVNHRAMELLRQLAPVNRRSAHWWDVLSGASYAKELRLYDAYRFFRGKWDAAFQHKLIQEHRLRKHRECVSGIGVAISFLGVIVATGHVCYMGYLGEMSPGDVVLAFGLVRQGSGALYGFLSRLVGMHESTLLVREYFSFIDDAAKPTDATEAFVPTPVRSIDFDRITFAYPGTERTIFDGFSLRIPAGVTTAIVGRNGCGKTTLIKLLTRLHDPQSGRVLLDGTPVTRFSVESLRRQFSVVFQDFCRYNMSVRENIAFHEVGPESRDRVDGAAAMAELGVVAGRLPNGLDTPLGREFAEGHELSGGEWQKLALARAFYRDAPIVVLDEPTASLDLQTEMEIFNQFRSLTKGRTAIIISHRLASVRRADHIVVLGENEVLESGTHDALMNCGGEYARLLREQCRIYGLPVP